MPRFYRYYDLTDYEITRNGEITNIHNGRKVKPQPNGKGYLRFLLNGKLVFVHRIVAQLYVPNPENKPQVNHKDGNKLNNCADNLEWVTNRENRDHALKNGLHMCGDSCSWSKLTKEKVEYIRNHPEIAANTLAEKYGVSATTIRSARRGETWKY